MLALLAGNAALALGPWLVRLADTGPVAAGFWRVALALPLVALIALANRQALTSHSPRLTGLALAGGVFFGFDIAAWHLGIGETRLANAVLFGNAGSVVLMCWAFIALRRLPQGREWPAIIAALTGAAILLGRSLEIAQSNFIGDLFCLLAGLLYAGYLLTAQDARKVMGGWAVLTWAGMASALVLLGTALVLGETIMPRDWTPLLILAFSSQIVGQGLLVYALRHFSPLIIGIALLTQPAVAAAVGWWRFDEILLPLDFLGIALVGSALVLARMAQPKVLAAKPPEPA
ncbi:Permease [Erythrobacter sp. EC-HK427]|nr:Permease [Erythrobacter sp. EC-HK427]